MAMRSRRCAGSARPEAGRGRGDQGASVAEYSLLLGLVALLCIVAIAGFAVSTTEVFDKAGDGFERAPIETPGGPPGTPPGSPGQNGPGPTSAPCPPPETPSTEEGCASTTTTEP